MGVVRKLLWEEYKSNTQTGICSCNFASITIAGINGSIPPCIEYKAGDKLLVGYTGMKLSIVEKQDGELIALEIFVSILKGSQLIYVEAFDSQQKTDFIHFCEDLLHFYGDVPIAIFMDNLNDAVAKSHRYEPKLNQDFADFAKHYEMAVFPTRAYRSKDKALVEGAVRIVYQQIFARLRGETFHSIEQLNVAISKLLDKTNSRRLSGRPIQPSGVFQ